MTNLRVLKIKMNVIIVNMSLSLLYDILAKHISSWWEAPQSVSDAHFRCCSPDLCTEDAVLASTGHGTLRYVVANACPLMDD